MSERTLTVLAIIIIVLGTAQTCAPRQDAAIKKMQREWTYTHGD